MREHEFEKSSDNSSCRNCDFDQELLSAWIDGELDIDDAQRVRDHLAMCSGCARELAALRNVNEQFSRVLAGTSSLSGPVGKSVGKPAITVAGRSAIRFNRSGRDWSGLPGTRLAARLLTILVLAGLVGLTGILLLQESPDVADRGKLDFERVHLAMTRVAEPLGRMVSNNESIRSQQVQCVKTMQQELRLLNLEATTLPENEQSRAVREEIHQLLATAQRLALESSDSDLE